jgi:hypothetical protein
MSVTQEHLLKLHELYGMESQFIASAAMLRRYPAPETGKAVPEYQMDWVRYYKESKEYLITLYEKCYEQT